MLSTVTMLTDAPLSSSCFSCRALPWEAASCRAVRSAQKPYRGSHTWTAVNSFITGAMKALFSFSIFLLDILDDSKFNFFYKAVDEGSLSSRTW